ncbi:flagellar hook protein FlgL [Stenotrophomonas ginsengisoli]|uniref:Flagellar hook protein FlgL n=1 Tax=Stenotrophomonas ginsengisoli TaxID=336566 RepID=A0A0R0DJJ7_9GAMM|nr:flagellar hook-associated protein FlgL [Stenotrophomonas ginsengisoli]KRG78914.1 flagellar hook protein FlgL [Stenotrophomonas ginsengisoli]
MSTRISTNMVYNASLHSMLGKQASLNKLQQQMATGQKLVSAKDDPVAAGTAVKLDRSLSALSQYAANADRVENRLGLQENAMTEFGELMAQVNDLTIQANNPVLSDADLKSIASQLRAIGDQLLAVANSTDGAGRYLFGGTSDGSAPFSRTGNTVTYNGDQTQRRVEVAPDTFVSDALAGSEVFMRIPTGNGTLSAQPAAGNSGTLVINDYATDANGGWDGTAYSLHFSSATDYEIRDSSNTAIATGTYTAGDDIHFAGLRVQLLGTPAAGDSIQVQPAPSRDVFATLDALATVLETGASTEAQVAARSNALQAGMRDVARAREVSIDARAAGGAQLAALDSAGSLRDADQVTIETTLSNLRDLDYAEAVSRYTLESTALQAAQTVFTQMQSMSLFNALR